MAVIKPVISTVEQINCSNCIYSQPKEDYRDHKTKHVCYGDTQSYLDYRSNSDFCSAGAWRITIQTPDQYGTVNQRTIVANTGVTYSELTKEF